MTDGRLAARYRRLLYAYPPGTRREELLDTLLDASPSGRTRPTAIETVNLVRHGMRTRLGRPKSTGVVVMAVFVAIITGFLGASVTARVAWEAAPSFPQGAALAHIGDDIYAGRPYEEDHDEALGVAYGTSRGWGESILWGQNEEYAFGTQTLSTDAIPGDYQAWIPAVRDRLVTHGWTIQEEYPTGATRIDTGEMHVDGRELVATRDGLSMLVSATTNQEPEVPGAFWSSVEIVRAPPGWLSALAVGSGLVVALFGWLLTGWVSRRTEHSGAVIRTPAVIAVGLMLPGTLWGLLFLVTDVFRIGRPGWPFWWPIVTYGWFFTQVATLLIIAVLIVAALQRPEPADAREMAGQPK
jgi:hypothetical protein